MTDMEASPNPSANHDPDLVRRIVEGALLASSQPLDLAALAGLFPLDQALPAGVIETALEELRAACEGRGVELVEVASGFRYQVRTEVHPWVARLWAERPQRYTRATLETLALIAYRQPITRGEIEQIRGVAVSSNIIKTLEEREWIRVIGHRDVPGKPALFGTTRSFLDYFSLKSLDALPPLSELRDLSELEPQLPLAPEFDETMPAPDVSPGELLLDSVDVVIAPGIPAIAAIDLSPVADGVPAAASASPETEPADIPPAGTPEHTA